MKRHIIVTVLALGAAASWAQQAPQADHAGLHPQGESQAAADLTDGEVRKVDNEQKKVTIRHGEIKNLDMPPMTMVFGVSRPELLDSLKAGDKVRFRAIDSGGGALVVTKIEAAR